ncbi:MAG: sugar transporter permease [Chloroflexi bacterium]|jgi:ABC-type sugar transport system permease subunit|nr:sugar transporter permease [Chloroflexota bacterium]
MENIINGKPQKKPFRPNLLREIARHWQEYLCIAPFFILFGIFFAFPIVWSLILSFQRWDGITDPQWVGLKNYEYMLNDSTTRKAMGNTLIFLVILLPLELILPFFFGVLLNQPTLKLRGVFRTLLFLPVVTSGVIIGIVFKFFFGSEFGWLNGALGSLGMGPYPWLKSEGWAFIPIITLFVWGRVGYTTLIVMGGLQSLDGQIYEAARMDGANSWQSFWRVTMPLMRPVVTFVLITTTIAIISMFSQPYVLTKGGPSNSTLTPLLEIYNISFGGRIGDGAALSFVLTLFMIIVALVQFRLSRAKD